MTHDGSNAITVPDHLASLPQPDLTENGLKILTTRYLFKNDSGEVVETPTELFWRVAISIAQGDAKFFDIKNRGMYSGQIMQTAKTFYELMTTRRFLPNSPTLMNAGRKGSLSACFVLPVGDDIKDIFEAAKNTAIVQKSGGGTGFDFSELRPEGDLVGSTKGVSSGPVSFMKMFNEVTEVIKQGSTRRGANMAMLRVDHPDVRKFISCKEDLTQLTNFNISVSITDKFMDALNSGGVYDIVNPRTGEVVRQENAQEIADLIADRAWRTGEPGLVFIDEINRRQPMRDEKITATNPCLSKGTMVLTRDGHFPIESLVGKTVEIWDGTEWRSIDNFRVTAENEGVYNVRLASGQTIQATGYHSFILQNGTRKSTLNLVEGDVLLTHDLEVHGTEKLAGAYLKGFLTGDGSTKRENPALYLYPPKFVCKDRLVASAGELPAGPVNTNAIEALGFVDCGENREYMTGLAPRSGVLFDWVTSFKSRLPEGFLNWDLPSKLDFIAGVMDADGTASDTKNGYMYQVSSIKKSWLLDFQLLLRSIGVRSKLSLMKSACLKDFGDDRGGEYETQDCYRLTIAQTGSVKLAQQVVFSRLSSFADKVVTYQITSKEPKVQSVEFSHIADSVYCCTVEGSHSFALSNGVVLGQCGEQPLAANESCNLGSINLTTHVITTSDGTRFVDWHKLQETVHQSVHFLDNVIQTNDYPTPEIQAGADGTRKIGLGVMGWADMLYMLGIPYNSQEAVKLGGEVMGFINETAIEASSELAKIRGNFPRWKNSVWAERELPMRNSCVTTVAPTGTISMISGCSGGVEPNFGLVFKRFQAGHRMIEVNPFFKQVAIDRGFYTDDLMDKVAINGSCQGIEGIPDDVKAVFVVAPDISPVDHVKMQAAFQDHVDSAVSKTINLPPEATREDVKNVYLLAHQLKCKGITVYRDGSRGDQVLSTESTVDPTKAAAGTSITIDRKDFEHPKAIAAQAAPDFAAVEALLAVPLGTGTIVVEPADRNRDQVLDGKTFRWKVGENNVYITVNSDQYGVREVFVNAGKCGSDVFSLCEAMGILISGMLKEGMGTELIKTKLKGIKADPTFNPGGLIHSIPDAIAASIKLVEAGVKQLSDLKKVASDSKSSQLRQVAPGTLPAQLEGIGVMPKALSCTQCADGFLVMMEGCMTCPSCGYSKCS